MDLYSKLQKLDFKSLSAKERNMLGGALRKKIGELRKQRGGYSPVEKNYKISDKISKYKIMIHNFNQIEIDNEEYTFEKENIGEFYYHIKENIDNQYRYYISSVEVFVNKESYENSYWKIMHILESYTDGKNEYPEEFYYDKDIENHLDPNKPLYVKVTIYKLS